MRPPAPRLVRVAGRAAWHIRDGGHRISTRTSDRAAAERALSAYLAGAARTPGPSLRALLDRYLADRVDAARPGAERLRYALAPVARFWAERPPAAVTEPELRRYRRTRAAEGAALATIRTELQALRAAFNFARRAGLAETLPAVPLPPRPPPRDRWLTRDEAGRLLAAATTPHLRLFITLALHTGGRRGAILALTWDRVDLTARRIDYRDPARETTRKRRVAVPVNDTLAAELEAARARATSAHVVEYAGRPLASVRHALNRAAARAGLAAVTPHTFRHTAATWLAQAGLPMWDIAGLLGNSVETVTQTYAHHHPEHLARAAKILG